MAASSDNNLNFVNLLKENLDLIDKSQVPSAKKKMKEAASNFIEKWQSISGQVGQVLTSETLFKKINNLTVRAKAAHNKGGPVSEWQLKILEMKVKFKFIELFPQNFFTCKFQIKSNRKRTTRYSQGK